MDALLDVRGSRDLETSGQVSLLDEVCCTKDPGDSWRQTRTRGRVGIQAGSPGTSGRVSLLVEVCCATGPGDSWRRARAQERVGVQAANPGSEVSLR